VCLLADESRVNHTVHCYVCRYRIRVRRCAARVEICARYTFGRVCARARIRICPMTTQQLRATFVSRARGVNVALCRRSRETLIAAERTSSSDRVASRRVRLSHTRGKGDFGTYIINNRVTRRHDAASYGGSFAATAATRYILDEPAYHCRVYRDSP